MNKVLVAGIETVVGGNLAACFARTQSVTGVALSAAEFPGGSDFELVPGSSPEAVMQVIDRVRPQRVIFCGAGSRSGWEGMGEPGDADVRQAASWMQATRQSETHLTLISSGAVFTGPWMFHAENSQSFCPSPGAQALRAIEAKAAELCPDSLVVRTHAFGWQPGGQDGWIEKLLAQIGHGQATGLDCFRHSSPILASDLTEVISRAWDAGLSGIYHIAGAERTNPVQLARRLAHHFHLPAPTASPGEFLIDRPVGFGCGEASLQTRKIRRALHVSLPMLEEGVQSLFQQYADGYRSRLTGQSIVPSSRVA